MRDQAGGDLVEVHAAVLLRHIDSKQSEVAQLAHELAAYVEVLGFDFAHLRSDLLFRKFGGHIGDLLLFRRYVFKGEDVLGGQVFDQEAAPTHAFRRPDFCCYSHCILPL